MRERVLLTGNQAIARGFWEAGGVVASSYPGSPTVEIMESLKDYADIQAHWAMNEKIALEIAIGGSFAGARSLVSMKHVGVNIAADPFMTFTQIRTNGGFVLVVGDDPGLSSSQNEQDSRFFAQFANCALLEPSNAQEAKDFVGIGLKISEQYGMPVIIRLTSTLCHSRSVVELSERTAPVTTSFIPDQARYCMLPPYANAQQYFMQERVTKLAAEATSLELDNYEDSGRREALLVTSGLPYQYLKELGAGLSVYKLGLCYPLPIARLKELAAEYSRVIVIEELMPFIEAQLQAAGLVVTGKEHFPFTGELTTERIKEGLEKAGLLPQSLKTTIDSPAVVHRSPLLCAGCPHRPVFHLLQKAKATVVGDIGCYSLGILPPFEVLKTNISMGASLGIIKGMAMAHEAANMAKPLVSVIGDGTLFHSGLSGFADLATTKHNITVIVLDNRTTAMTGGQPTPTTGELGEEPHTTNIAAVLMSLGIGDVTVADQFDYSSTKTVISDAMKRDGLSVVIVTRPCALNFRIREPHFYVDREICISCRACIGVNCPPISMQVYEGQSKKNSYINPHMCVGCSVCSQVCPVKAIKYSVARGEDQA
ncbi:MAG: 4Fe-4S binding protein [Thermaerobacter sp.]|nr:4Fe-4S binding protein [Thermaerobacter sp.]